MLQLRNESSRSRTQKNELCYNTIKIRPLIIPTRIHIMYTEYFTIQRLKLAGRFTCAVSRSIYLSTINADFAVPLTRAAIAIGSLSVCRFRAVLCGEVNLLHSGYSVLAQFEFLATAQRAILVAAIFFSLLLLMSVPIQPRQ